jgi:phosphatidylserine decarboxylase
LCEGEKVSVGQRLGVIKLGSLVAVVLPKREDVRIDVQPGDRVAAGVTVLARYEASEDAGIEGEGNPKKQSPKPPGTGR